MNPQEFAQKIKEKYPQYAGMDDIELSKKIIQKYPQYQQQVNFDSSGQTTEGNSFEEKPKGLWDKFTGLATSIVGGGKTAEGAGLALAAPKIQSQLGEAQQESSDIGLQLIKTINEKKARGEDVTKLQNAYDSLNISQAETQDVQSDFTEALPSTKEVVGSSARVVGTLAGGTIAKAFTPATKATGLASGLAQGVKVGALTGATEGAIQGAGIGLEQDKDLMGVAGSTLTGATIGGVAGGLIGGVAGGVRGIKNAPKPDPIDFVTPETTQLTPRQYKDLLAQGRITPKTASSPAQVVISDGEKAIVNKYGDLFEKDPVKTFSKVSDKISELDGNVGTFLKKKNGIFNSGELKNKLSDAISDIDDLSVDEARLGQVKEKLVKRFTESLEKNDMVSLWKARKSFDSSIESAFKGAPSVQKEIKIAFRNAVQDFIAERTKDGTYKGLMSEMSNLYKVNDLVSLKAVKERGASGITQWIKDNPKKAKALGYGATVYAGSQVIPSLLPSD